jgi:methyl-accepting chemotaxis protein
LSFADQLLSYRALERLISTLHRVRQGDFTARMAAEGDGVDRDVADAINELVVLLATLTREFEQLAKSVAQGELQGRITMDKIAGSWAAQTRAMNELVASFGNHVAEARRAVKAVHAGDLTRTIDVGTESMHHRGELRAAADEINAMMSHLRVIASKLTDAIMQLNREGHFGKQCHIADVGGAWILLVGSLNAMTASLAEQIRDLGATSTAFVNGNLSARASGTGRGDLAELRSSLNGAGESMAGWCEELRRVSQLLISEGKLVELCHPNPRGDWQSAQDTYNRANAMLNKSLRTVQQGIAKLLAGDYSTETTADAPGELGSALERINALARQEQRTQHTLEQLLAGRFVDTMPGASERDNTLFLLGIRLKHEWLSAARAGLLDAFEKHESGPELSKAVLHRIAGAANAAAAAYYAMTDRTTLVQVANLGATPDASPSLRVGDGLVGKAALDGKPITLDNLEAHGARLRSGLVEITPRSLVIFPLKDGERVIGVIELVFTSQFSKVTLELLDYLSADLVERATRPARSAPSAGAGADQSERVRALEEELLIASTRLDHIRNDLQQRDKSMRELQSEANELRSRLEQHVSDRAAENHLF